MKRNLFEVDSNEIKRILTLHEERSKTQYLNIISEGAAKGTYENPYTDAELQIVVDDLVDELDLAAYEKDLQQIKNTLVKYAGKVAVDNTKYYNPKKLSAIFRIRQLYFQDENEKLIDDVQGVANFGGQTEQLKSQIVDILQNYNEGVVLKAKEKITNVVTKDHKFGSIFIPAKSTFNKFNNQFVVITTPKGNKVWYDCDSQTYSTGGEYIKGDGALEFLLNKDVKGCNKNTPPNSKFVGPPKTNAERKAEEEKKAEEQRQAEEQKKAEELKLQPDEFSKLTPKQQQFYTNTTNYINQVQKELGLTETGKLTNGDIDTLITKLKTK